MNIVTGYRGEPHITSQAAQAFNQGTIGTGNYVFNIGEKFSATLADVNTVTIADGEAIMQGCHFRIEPGESETVNIANGTTGMNRKDLICARYTKDSATGIENVELVVIQGEESSSTATDPTYNTGDILDGDSPIDFPLYRVDLAGLTPTLVRLFSIRKSPATLVSSTSGIAVNGTVTFAEDPKQYSLFTFKVSGMAMTGYASWVSGTEIRGMMVWVTGTPNVFWIVFGINNISGTTGTLSFLEAFNKNNNALETRTLTELTGVCLAQG